MAENKAALKSTVKVLKWLGLGVAILLALLLAATVVMLVWLSYGDIKPKVEKLIAVATGQPASIQKLTFSPSSHLKFLGLSMSPTTGVKLKLDEFNAEFNPSRLFELRLDIVDVTIINPVITITTQSAKREGDLEKAGKNASKPYAIPEIRLPKSPALIALGSLKVNYFTLIVDGPDKLTLNGINLSAKGNLGPNGPEGTVEITNSTDSKLLFNGTSTKADGKLDINIFGELKQNGQLKILGETALSSGSFTGGGLQAPTQAKSKIDFETNITNDVIGDIQFEVSLFGSPLARMNAHVDISNGLIKYQAKITKFDFKIEEILKIIQLSDVVASGIVNFAPMDVVGEVPMVRPGDGSHRLTGPGMIQVYSASAAGMTLPKGGRIMTDIKGLEIKGGALLGRSLTSIAIPSIKAKGIADVENISVTVEGGPQPGGTWITYLSASAKSISTQGLKITKPLMNGSIVGDFPAGEIKLIKIGASTDGGSRLMFLGSTKEFGQDKIDMTINAEIAVPEVMSIVEEPLITKADGSVIANFKVKGSMGKEFTQPNFEINYSIKGDGLGVDIKSQKLAVTGGAFNVEGKIDVGQPKLKANITADTWANLQNFELGDSFRITDMKLESNISTTKAAKVGINGSVSLKSPSFISLGDGLVEARKTSQPISLHAGFSANAAGPSIELNKFIARLGNHLEMAATGSVDAGDGTFDIDLTSLTADLGYLFNALPKTIKTVSRLDKLNGRLSGAASLSGAIPKESVNVSVPFPFRLDGQFNLSNVNAHIPSQKLDINNLSANLTTKFDKGLSSTMGGVWIDSIEAPDQLGEVRVDPSLEFEIVIGQSGYILLDRFVFEIPRLGLVEALEGKIDGIVLDDLLAGNFLDDDFIGRLGIELENYVTIALEKTMALTADVKIGGEVDNLININLSPGKPLRISGQIEMANLLFELDNSRFIRELTGKFPFSKTLYIGKKTQEDQADQIQPVALGVRETSFYNDIRGQSSFRDNIQIGKVSVEPIKLDNTVFDIFFKESSFGVDYFRTSLLGGGLTGSFLIKSGDGKFTIRTNEVFAGINLSTLLPEKVGLSGEDAEVDGAMNLEMGMDHAKRGAIDITNIKMSAHLSRIGARALDRLLLFLDPKESAPSIMNARLALRYAKPARVDVIAKHGNLSLDIDLKYNPLLGGHTVTMPVIKRFPIHRLVNFESIRAYLTKLGAVGDVLKMLAATRLEADDKGVWRLR